jgi:hypothetical protein
MIFHHKASPKLRQSFALKQKKGFAFNRQRLRHKAPLWNRGREGEKENDD